MPRSFMLSYERQNGTHCMAAENHFPTIEEKQIYFSPEIAHRVAAIDIGSNSVRLMVAEPLRGGNYRILDEEREATRLGRSLNSTGRLDPEAVELTLAALRRFKQIADGFQ